MDYQAHYGRLIERAKVRELSGYVERHHIVPRCLGGTDAEENMVGLTAEEHYVAHQLLIRIYPQETKLVWAAHMMATRPGNKLYGWLRRAMVSARTGTKQSPEHVAKLSAVRKGRKLSAEHKAKISAGVRGTVWSDESRQRASEAAKRRGIPPEQRAKMLENQRNAPRVPHSAETIAKIVATKAAKPYRHSEETKIKMAASRQGRKLSPEHRASISAAATGKVRGPYKKGA